MVTATAIKQWSEKVRISSMTGVIYRRCGMQNAICTLQNGARKAKHPKIMLFQAGVL